MSFFAGSDRDAAAQRGPYVDECAKFHLNQEHDPSNHHPHHHHHHHSHSQHDQRAYQKPPLRQSSGNASNNFIDLTGDSDSPPISPRPKHFPHLDADRATPSSWKSKPEASQPPSSASRIPLGLGPAHNSSVLSDPSGASTAVSSNAASVLDPSPPPVSIQTSVDLDDSYDAEMPRLARPDAPLETAQQVTPPSSTRPSSNQSPKVAKHVTNSKKQTPNKGISDFNHITSSLTKYSHDIRKNHVEMVLYALKSTKPRETRVSTGHDWFADVGISPTTEEKGTTMKIRVKQHFRGRKADQGRDAHYLPVCVKSTKDAVPKYRFHHTEIVKNVLSPNSMLKFVPVIRDLEPEEERDYLLWLNELERMDASCGFKTLGNREDRVNRTFRKERTATLSLFLDSWLKKLNIDNCNRTTLIRHMASSESDDAITPQQKTSLVNLHSDDNLAATPRALKAARVFTEAFDYVFYQEVPKDRGVLLRDVLKLDKSVDEIVESKKAAKGDNEKASSLEHWIETHTVMGCLICYSNSCEHGDYSIENHKRNFSMDCIGMYGRMFSANRVISSKEDPEHSDPPPPCQRGCFQINANTPDASSRPWTEDETNLLRSLFTILDHNKVRVKAQCATAEILNRSCWDVNHHLQSLGITLPPLETFEPARVKNLPWYDRKKKMLIGDWQDHTNSHDTKVRPSNDPCHHDGPCTAENCTCIMNDILCEKFCRCTEDCCAYKFTGCACHASGKTCLQKQKEGRPCICVQLNRECDPDLCGTCGAVERADPANRHDDALFQTGCQNIAIQRGVSKAVVLGKSQLEGCGYGLFTAEDIAQDEFVIEYTGELIVADEGVRREARRGEAFAVEKSTSYVFSLLDYEGIWVDAAIYGNLSRYINHAVEAANVQPGILYVNGEYRIRFSATRSIKAGEELFFNYGENFPNLTKKMIKEKADNEDGEVGVEEKAAPVKRGRGGRRRTEKAAVKQTTQKFAKAKIAKGVRTGARKEAPKLTADDYEALADFEVVSGPGRKRKRAARSDDEEEEYHPSLESEDAQDASKRSIPAHRKHRRMKSKNLHTDSEADDSTQTSPRIKLGRGRGRPGASRTASRARSVAKTQTAAGKSEAGSPVQKKRRGRPPKNPRPLSPAENDKAYMGDVKNEIHASFTASSRSQEVEGDTISVGLDPPRSARGRKLTTRGLSPEIHHMDIDEELDVNATPSRSRGRKRNDANTITARGPSRSRRASTSQARLALIDTDDDVVVRAPGSQRKGRLAPFFEVNDSESSYQNNGVEFDSEDDDDEDDIVDPSLRRAARARKKPARFRVSDDDES
ncbi:Histone-lysine N-methyltransferase EZH1 [Colletotrichum siamense]|uniref:Histone-lysine N-methyltransferase EZH1 n=1 Tax=Colletotrichum siamense TaxID=690259 RepID=UPI0018725FE7|nr:Histone-lysine N-methyltransferase EZH1 [Colletotrichum siamense]KAF5492315.1 Histone-lysine N-methyltransferase EZH1 [Colletotrichum siamense]